MSLRSADSWPAPHVGRQSSRLDEVLRAGAAHAVETGVSVSPARVELARLRMESATAELERAERELKSQRANMKRFNYGPIVMKEQTYFLKEKEAALKMAKRVHEEADADRRTVASLSVSKLGRAEALKVAQSRLAEITAEQQKAQPAYDAAMARVHALARKITPETKPEIDRLYHEAVLLKIPLDALARAKTLAEAAVVAAGGVQGNAQAPASAGTTPVQSESDPLPGIKMLNDALSKRARLKAIQRKIEEANAAALKDPKGVLMQQWRDMPIEPQLRYQVVLRFSSNERWRAINKLFSNVNPNVLGHGRDQTEKGDYNTLTPVGVFDIHYGTVNPRRDLYLAERDVMSLEDGCNEYGKPFECVRTDKPLAGIAKNAHFPALNNQINEKLLLHGTKVSSIPLILGGGFERRYGVAEAYGPANYQAEDPGKPDQYVVSDGYEDFNNRLGLDVSQYGSPKTYYMLVSRTLLGCANHVKSGGGKKDINGKNTYDDKQLFRLPYDSVIVEHGSTLRGGYNTGSHYREFLVQDNDRILPVMLVAYVREKKQREFNPEVVGC